MTEPLASATLSVMERTSPVRLRQGIIHRSWRGEHYFLTPDGRFHSVVDPVGSMVLSLLSRREQTLETLLRQARRRFEVPSETEMITDLEEFLQGLCKRGIVEFESQECKQQIPRETVRRERRSR